ncbi:hypothetical protein [Phenylobacterium sp.]|uniref:hypothetical protein n=1 Tax=Phenylobacterium sp. TaxID=1871053 RepID=UPI002737BCBD|nr:hypothetical protein [Phenylobacterium sp.]MDP3869905.1 hypothetical protein [Phenylobacterium sp.]
MSNSLKIGDVVVPTRHNSAFPMGVERTVTSVKDCFVRTNGAHTGQQASFWKLVSPVAKLDPKTIRKGDKITVVLTATDDGVDADGDICVDRGDTYSSWVSAASVIAIERAPPPPVVLAVGDTVQNIDAVHAARRSVILFIDGQDAMVRYVTTGNSKSVRLESLIHAPARA